MTRSGNAGLSSSSNGFVGQLGSNILWLDGNVAPAAVPRRLRHLDPFLHGGRCHPARRGVPDVVILPWPGLGCFTSSRKYSP